MLTSSALRACCAVRVLLCCSLRARSRHADSAGWGMGDERVGVGGGSVVVLGTTTSSWEQQQGGVVVLQIGGTTTLPPTLYPPTPLSKGYASKNPYRQKL